MYLYLVFLFNIESSSNFSLLSQYEMRVTTNKFCVTLHWMRSISVVFFSFGCQYARLCPLTYLRGKRIMFIRSLRKFGETLKSSKVLPNLFRSTCAVQSVNIVFKRHASIHTRHILIQKARLEHVSSFGVFLLVIGSPLIFGCCYFLTLSILETRESA